MSPEPKGYGGGNTFRALYVEKFLMFLERNMIDKYNIEIY